MYKVKNKIVIIYYLSMPRTEHLANLNANHIYALDARVQYVHHTPTMTTAIIEDEGVQSKIKIPQSLNNIRDEIEEGMKYHFGYCYIAPNGWIKARNPDASIRAVQENSQSNAQLMMLSDIANNSQSLNGKYLSTVLYVIKVNQAQEVIKNGNKLTLCIINCYANGYLIDVTLWNSDLPIAEMDNKWIMFYGFRLKKLMDWKFMLVSTVYSKIAAYEGETKSIPYSPHAQYYSLSTLFQSRTVNQISKLTAASLKYFSLTQALIKKIETFNYDGCSKCKKKTIDGMPCVCAPNTDIRVYSIQKISLVGSDETSISCSVFDEAVQKQLLKLSEPTILKFQIKSSVSMSQTGEIASSHIITKATF